jgi:hypothetical protein
LDELVASLPLDQQREIAETVYQFCKRNDIVQDLVQWELRKEIEHTGTKLLHLASEGTFFVF